MERGAEGGPGVRGHRLDEPWGYARLNPECVCEALVAERSYVCRQQELGRSPTDSTAGYMDSRRSQGRACCCWLDTVDTHQVLIPP